MKRNCFFILLCVGIAALMGLRARPAVAQVYCGATLTTDTTLIPTDPVVFDPAAQPGDTACAQSGLILGDAITLDCAGLTLKGKGKGTGINIAAGVEGATILNCTVDNFQTGIKLGGLGSHSVEGAVVMNNKINGVELPTDFNFLTGMLSRKNGRMGFLIRGVGNAVEGSVALENGKAGFSIRSKEHSLDSNFSILNGEQGFEGSGRIVAFSLNNAISNKGNGLNFTGGSVNEPNDFSENKAIANGGNGIFVGGANPDANVDSGGNKGLANTGPIQCQIAGQPCQ
ncbi:MAG: right-handed parallel beta-helix repeat-containing protein [Deltaproteobacteria bacterium]|nr:right-handed parallel beta-helix repeat-containing protein [Deltaproteobacteria bacterium]